MIGDCLLAGSGCVHYYLGHELLKNPAGVTRFKNEAGSTDYQYIHSLQ